MSNDRESRTWIKRALTTCLLTLTVLLIANPSEAGIFDKLKELVKGSGQQSAEETGAEAGNSETADPLTEEDIGDGLKDALSVGVETVVGQLGAVDGFNLDPSVHIPLPKSLDKVRSALEKVGMSSTFEELELGLNRAAEVAVPKSRELLLSAIQDLTLDDVLEIYRGPDDAATQHFRSRMAGPLNTAMRPVVDESLSQVGATDIYGRVADTYNSLPFVSPVDADLTDYVLEKGADGIFLYLAQEEAAIRRNPVKRTTELLQKVFEGF
jgi:hypothetical protein